MENSDHDKLTEVIERCREGDSESFVWLLDAYGNKLYHYFFRICGSRDLAEDLVQDLFVKLLVKIKNYRHENKFENWLFRVAANMLRDHFRKQQRQIKTSALPADELPQANEDRFAHVQQLELQEQVDQLQLALQLLSPDDREMILLKHYSGMGYKEIAEQFQMPLGTVLAKVHRGLKKLNKYMIQVADNEK